MAKQKQPVAQGASKRRTTARKQTCILVLGMHRSGTSAITRTIALFGAELPRGILGSNPTNEAGHWEPERLIAYNDQLLGQLSSSWHDWRPLDMTRLAPERREKARADIRALIEADYPGSPLFVVKEPRICRFAGFFMEALDDARIDVVPIITFRNPLEVVASLEKRSTIWPASYSEGDAALLWLSHVLEAEKASRGRKRAFVSYEELMANWRTAMSRLIKQTGIHFTATANEVAPLVDEFLRKDLRHHAKTAGDVALNPVLQGWVSDTFEALVQLCVNPSAKNACNTLDRVYQEFRRSFPILQNLLEAAHRRVDAAVKTEQELRQQSEGALAEQTRKAEDLATRMSNVEAELVASHGEIDRLTELSVRSTQIDDQLLSYVRAELGLEPGDNRPPDQLVDDLLSRFQQRKHDLQTARSYADNVAGEVAAKDQHVAQLERVAEDNATLLSTALSELEDLRRRSSAQDEALESLRSEKSALQSEMEKLRNWGQVLEARVKETDGERNQAKAEEQHMRHVLDAVYGSTSWRMTSPIRAVKRTTGQIVTTTRLGFRLVRSGRMNAQMIKKGVKRLPALFREGKFASPTDFSSMVETLTPEEVARIVGAFNAAYYLANNPDVARARVDPLSHFMRQGWKEHRDPSSQFSVSYYLTRYPDIARAGINPFIHYVLHGERERRSPLPYEARLDKMDFQPKVSAIVPNYNHARFLDRRISSILEQSYENIEVIVLDDCSSDDSREVIEKWRSSHPSRIKAIFNEENSGNVFRQWRKGVEAAEGDLVWICESDDFCNPDFVEKLVKYFRDRSVQIAFGRIQFADKEGHFQAGLDQYREGAEAGIWDAPVVRPARQWFSKAFGVNNVIANVGGCVWRRQVLREDVWHQAEQFSVLGDWFLYCHLAGGGQIAYEPTAIAYFRQHGQNTSVTSFSKAAYYEEHSRLMTLLRENWGVPSETVEQFLSKVEFQYRHFKVEKTLGPLSRFLDKQRLLSVPRDRPHILLVFLGFHSGGGEVFPINLANALHDQGHLVSMMALDMSHVNPEMLAALNSGIPVYDAAWVAEIGADNFLVRAGVSIIHSHMISLEFFFFKERRIKTAIPYLVSLHGSYESGMVDSSVLEQIANRVTHWVYTADKNLEPFRLLELPPERFSKLGNGMPIDLRPFPQSREELGIEKEAVVFTLVARGILRKGWRASIAAFVRLRERHPNTRMHLLLCGDGEQTELHQKTQKEDPDISFLGYQSRIPGLYRLSDVAIVPTRFAGESFPLCIIQALQTGTPVISTRVGEIASMIEPDGSAPAGILLDPVRDTEKFIESLVEAMEAMLSEDRRGEFATAAKELAGRYDISNVARDYIGLYDKILENK